jgi:hypothetical protein
MPAEFLLRSYTEKQDGSSDNISDMCANLILDGTQRYPERGFSRISIVPPRKCWIITLNLKHIWSDIPECMVPSGG